MYLTKSQLTEEILIVWNAFVEMPVIENLCDRTRAKVIILGVPINQKFLNSLLLSPDMVLAKKQLTEKSVNIWKTFVKDLCTFLASYWLCAVKFCEQVLLDAKSSKCNNIWMVYRPLKHSNTYDTNLRIWPGVHVKHYFFPPQPFFTLGFLNIHSPHWWKSTSRNSTRQIIPLPSGLLTLF